MVIWGILFAGLTKWNWNKAASLLIALAPIYLIRFSIGGLPSTLLEVMIGILAVAFIVGIQTRARAESNGRTGRTRAAWCVCALIVAAASIIGIFVADDKIAALGIWRAFFLEPAILGAMITARFEKLDWERTVKYLAVSGGLIGAIAILQTLTGMGIEATWALERRATGVFDFPNAVGLWLAPIGAMVTMALVRARGAGRDGAMPRLYDDMLYGATIALMLGGIIASQTEAALIAWPGAVVTVTFARLIARARGIERIDAPAGRLYDDARAYVRIAGAGGALIVLAVIIFSVPGIREKILLQDYSGQVRRSQWKEMVELLVDRPITGAGIAGYGEALVPYHKDTQYEIFEYPHNLFLNFWTELGLLGLIGLIIFIGIILKLLIQKEEPDDKTVIFLTAILTMLIHGLVDVPFFKNDLAILSAFLVVGLMRHSSLRSR